MAKSFKLRISRAIKSCRSKDPSTLPQDPVPSFFRLSPVNPKLIALDLSLNPSQPSKPSSSFRRHLSSTLISIGCGVASKPAGAPDPYGPDSSQSHHFKWQQDEKFHVIAKIYDDTPPRKTHNSSASGESDDSISALPPPPTAERRKRKNKKKKRASRVLLRTSTSSTDSGWFSSDERAELEEEEEGEETETLVSSSRSFSTDSSSEFNPQLEPILEAPISRKIKKKPTKPSSKRSVSRTPQSPENETPARLSVFKKLIPCSVEGKVKDSFAIVKKSEDPFGDFKKSMMEMIMEKQMFERDDLEQLLQCFLSLNSRRYHGVIVEAFTAIWEALFSAGSTQQRRRA